MEANNNPLMCDPETGVCELPGIQPAGKATVLKTDKKPLRILYFTDPICSSCWGIEPQLRRLKLEYGADVEFVYYMGGLLPDWSYNSGGISKPADVAGHWDEVSQYYKMPIDGDVWLEDPLPSSYPPSIAFKAAQLQHEDKAIAFLRLLRERVFLQKKNIARWEVIEQAAEEATLDVVKLKQDYEGIAPLHFQDDLIVAREMSVRGFPAIFIQDGKDKTELVYGVKPYAAYEEVIKRLYPAANKATYSKEGLNLFTHYPTLTVREYAELCDTSYEQAEAILEAGVTNKQLGKLSTKNGAIYSQL